jgi:hypothetical protein
MSKESVVQELEQWITDEAFSPDRERLQGIQERFNELQEADEKAALEEHLKSGEEEVSFSYSPSTEDARFKALLGIYHDKRKALDQQRKKVEANNLSEKKALVEELNALIQDEENIGKAYQRFDAIKQKWNELGPVPNADRRDLQAEYSRLIEQFYYNIKIYRELQINDLKKNQELKEEVIEKIKLLADEKSINQVDFLIHQYLDEWDQIGPTFREEWDKIRESFREEVGKVFDRIREHRKAIKDEHQKNLEAKEALIEQVEALAAEEMSDVQEVQKRSRAVIDLQKEWKKIGYAGRGKNDKVWKSFRTACDEYFGKRDRFMEASNAELKEVREKKKQLIERAKSIHQGDDHKQIADTLKGMQREWKQSGKLLPHEEYKLFKEFRKYCDAFFNRKKQAADEAIKEAKENLAKKEGMLEQFEKTLEKGIKAEGEAAIAEWQSAWGKIGGVPSKLRGKIEKQFEDLIAKAYESLGVSKEDLVQKQFDAKLDRLSNAQHADDALLREKRAVIDKIKAAQTSLAQEESKMDFFKYSDDSNPLKKELMNRIEAVKEDIEGLRQQKKQIDLTIKQRREEEKQSNAEKNEEEASESAE